MELAITFFSFFSKHKGNSSPSSSCSISPNQHVSQLTFFFISRNAFDREHFFNFTAEIKGIFILAFGNVKALYHITEPIFYICLYICVYVCVCASVFSEGLKGNFTLLMTFTCDNRWEYQHIVFVFMEMNYCFGIKTCTSCWAHNTPLDFLGNISWLCSTFHILYGHFDDSVPFAHA